MDKPIKESALEESAMLFSYHLFDYMHGYCVLVAHKYAEDHPFHDDQEINGFAIEALYQMIAEEECYDSDYWTQVVDRMAARILAEGEVKEDKDAYLDCM